MDSTSSNSNHPIESSTLDRSVAARAWAYGWAISRCAQTPIEHPGYYQVFVGKPEQMTRYVLPNFDQELIQRLVSIESGPGTWLKICAPSDIVSPLLSNSWDIHEPEFLMCASLAGSRTPATGGYRVHTETAGALAFAKIVTEAGELAASGQVAIDDSFASFDKIVTAEAHRRRGLGRHLMTTLTSMSLDLGAKKGVLVATEAGAALYKALGWSMVSPVTAASHSGSPAHST